MYSLFCTLSLSESLKIDMMNKSLLLNHISDKGEVARTAIRGAPEIGFLSAPCLPLGCTCAQMSLYQPSGTILVLPSTLLMTPAELVASSMIKLGDHILLEFLGCSKFGNRIALPRHNILRVFLKLPPKQGSCKEILLHLKL